MKRRDVLMIVCTAAALVALALGVLRHRQPAAQKQVAVEVEQPGVMRESLGARVSPESSGVAPTANDPAAILARLNSDRALGYLAAFGRVTDTGGTPLAGAQVHLGIADYSYEDLSRSHRHHLVSTQTDDAGRFRIADCFAVAAGSYYSLVVVADGYERASAMRQAVGPTRVPDPALRQVEWEWNPRLGPEMRLAGRVIDSVGHAIAEARVLAVPMKDPEGYDRHQFGFDEHRRLESQTDADGRFRLHGASALAYLVMIERLPGVIEFAREITAPDNQIEIVLQAPTGSLSGTVYREDTGEPVAGLAIRATTIPDVHGEFATHGKLAPAVHALFLTHLLARSEPGDAGAVVTAPDGTFAIEGLPPGSYQFDVLDDVLLLSENQRSLHLDTAQQLEGVEVLVHDGYLIEGTVYLAGTREGVPGVKVRARLYHDDMLGMATGPEAITDSAGRYRLKVRWTVAQLWIDSTEYQLHRARDLTTTFSLNPRDRRERYDLEVHPILHIAGTVRDTSGRSLAGGLVLPDTPHLYSRTRAATVGEDGTFRLQAARNARYSIWYESPDHPLTLYGTLHLGDSSIEGIEIVVAPGANLAGVVVDPEGQPVADATVNVTIEYHSPGSSRFDLPSIATDATGRFVIENLPAQVIRLVASAPGHGASVPTRYALESGIHRDDARVVLHAGGVVSALVLDHEGNPAAGYRWWAWPQGVDEGTRPDGTVDSQGRFSFDGRTGARYTVSVQRRAGTDSLASVEVTAPQTDLVIHLSEPQARTPSAVGEQETGILFLGTVVDAQTKLPIDSFEVAHTMSSNAQSSPWPERDRSVAGLFRYRPRTNMVPPFVITAPGYAPLRTESIQFRPARVEDGVIHRVFEMTRGARIEGRVVDKATGDPVVNVRVELSSSSPRLMFSTSQPPTVTLSDAQGIFVFDDVPTGTQYLRLLPAPPYVEHIERVAGREDTEVVSLGDIAIDEGMTVWVEVFDTATQSPVRGVVLIHHQGIATYNPFGSSQVPRGPGVRTGPDGRALLTGIAGTTLLVGIEDTPVRAIREEVADGDVLRLPVGNASLELTFTLDGASAPETSVTLEREPNPSGESPAEMKIQFPRRIADSGSGLIQNLAAGEWRIRAMSSRPPVKLDDQRYAFVDNTVQAFANVTLVDGETLQLTLSFDR